MKGPEANIRNWIKPGRVLYRESSPGECQPPLSPRVRPFRSSSTALEFTRYRKKGKEPGRGCGTTNFGNIYKTGKTREGRMEVVLGQNQFRQTLICSCQGFGFCSWVFVAAARTGAPSQCYQACPPRLNGQVKSHEAQVRRCKDREVASQHLVARGGGGGLS